MRGIEQYLQVDAATLGALKYQGTWNASTNTPTLTSSVGVQGQYYVVSVAGSTNLNGETNWGVGDWAVFNGSVWQKVDGGSTGLLTTLTVTGNTYLATTSGNVGIGTTSPNGKLDVVGAVGAISVNGNGNLLGFSTAGQNYIYASTAGGFFTFSVNGGTEAMRIDTSGNVGIGTTSPIGRFAVVGSAVGAGIFSVDTDATRVDIQSYNKPLAINRQGNNVIFNEGGGNVGIGTTSPAAKLDIASAGTVIARVQNTTTSADAYFQAQNTVATGLFGVNATGQYMYTAQSVPTLFYNGGSEKMRITSAGDVGIGTSSPGAKLDVVSIGATAFFGSTTANNSYIGFKYNNTTLGYVGNGAGVAAGSAATDFSIGSTGSRALTFGTNDTERLRITSAGNIHTPAGATTMTNGFFYIPAAAGVPTGAPTAITGTVPMYYDTTNNKFYVYNGAWKSVALL